LPQALSKEVKNASIGKESGVTFKYPINMRKGQSNDFVPKGINDMKRPYQKSQHKLFIAGFLVA